MTLKISPLPLAAALLAAVSLQACHRREAPPPASAPQTGPASDTTAPASPASGASTVAQTSPDMGAGGQAGNPQGGGMGMGAGPGGVGRAGRMGGMGMGGMGMAGVTLQQFQARFRQRMLTQVDTDHDGRISLQEWTAWRNAHPRPNGAGVDPARQFQHLDLNHDGYIEPDELDVMAARRYQHRMAMTGGGAAPAMGATGSQGEADGMGPQ